MRFLKFIVPVLLVFQIAVFAKGFKKSKVVSSATSNCKTIGKNPLVTVCVESATEDAKVSKRLVKAFRSAAKELVNNFSSESSLSSLISPEDYGEEYEEECNYQCDSPYTWHPCCGAETYCDAVPNDPTHCDTDNYETY